MFHMWSPLSRLVLVSGLGGGLSRLRAASVAAPVPVLYCTDLFHPHDDPDDHFDLATIYAIPGIELRGIVLDQGDKQQQRPGRIPVGQLNALTGRSVPWRWLGNPQAVVIFVSRAGRM